ncbi:hypothetical protein KC926_01415 [Candidatus Kaiserbacteria bacterium]|nr:hypothetical protein [Candidatus Kaiserbacteria bacterium]
MTLCKDSPEGCRDVFSNRLIVDPISGIPKDQKDNRVITGIEHEIPKHFLITFAGLEPTPKEKEAQDAPYVPDVNILFVD